MTSIPYLLFLVIVIFCAVLTAYSAVIGAPFLPTPTHLLRRVFEEAGLKKGDRIYDLGSGTGKMLVIAEKYFGAIPVGFELSPILYIFSKINLFLKRTKKSKIIFGNFYNQNISDADVVFTFLIPRSMKKLKSKFERELRHGAKVISYVSEIKGWEPKKILKKEGMPAVFIYEIS